MRHLKKGLVTVMIASGLLITSISLNNDQFVSANSDNKNAEETEIKVVVGQAMSPKDSEKKNFKNQRVKALKDKSSSHPNDISKATVTFNNFKSAEELSDLLKQHGAIKVENVWFSIPNETGRGMVIVENNDFNSAMNKFLEKSKKYVEDSNDRNAKNDHEELEKGNYGIFAMTVTAKYKHLESLSDDKSVKLIDIHFNQEAEDLAKKDNKRVKYIILPEKPDGTK